jgi:hypothetical protein
MSDRSKAFASISKSHRLRRSHRRWTHIRMINSANTRRILTVGALLIGGSLIAIALFATNSWPFREREEVGRYGMVDPSIGHVPRAGITAGDVREYPRGPGFRMHIDQDGIRSNGDQRPTTERPLTLVAGDSFVFGDDVDDGESWPAYLERSMDRRVVNGGVPGFGLDQAVLWAERLSERFHPENIVVAFIPHDIIRCEFSAWPAGAKPYFEIDDAGELRLHALPESPSSQDPTEGIRARRTGRPRFLSGLREGLSISRWLDGFLTRNLNWEGPITYAHHRGKDVACLLMTRLAALGRQHHARVVVVAYPERPVLSDDENDWYETIVAWGRAVSLADEIQMKNAVLTSASDNGLQILDFFAAFGKLTIEERRALYHDHLSPAGNRLVAREVEALLEGHPQAPPPRGSSQEDLKS